MPARLRFAPLDPSAPELVEFLCGETWPFHGQPSPTPAEVAWRVGEGSYESPDNEGHWIYEGSEQVGLVVLRELGDPTPVFDLRLRARARGRGLGREVLGWLAGQVFLRHDKHRLEGHTRADNAAMRRCFERAGWTQEAHYRQAWPDEGGAWHDATAYTLLRCEWASGASLPLPAAFVQRLEGLRVGGGPA